MVVDLYACDIMYNAWFYVGVLKFFFSTLGQKYCRIEKVAGYV